MNRYSVSSIIRKHLSATLWIAMMSFTVFFSPVTISASENLSTDLSQPLSDKDKAMVKQIHSYLSSHCLYPFLEGGRGEYLHLGFMEETPEGTIYTLGIISQKENRYFTMFSFKKGWIWDEVKLVYLTNDEPLSPIVFNSIIPKAISLLSKQIPDYHIFIEAIEDNTLPKGEKVQRWIFFNPSEYAELYVLLKEDNYDTYFKVIPPK